MTALGQIADTRLGRMSVLTDTGHSELLRTLEMNVRFRPEAPPSITFYANVKRYLHGKFVRIVTPLVF